MRLKNKDKDINILPSIPLQIVRSTKTKLDPHSVQRKEKKEEKMARSLSILFVCAQFTKHTIA